MLVVIFQNCMTVISMVKTCISILKFYEADVSYHSLHPLLLVYVYASAVNVSAIMQFMKGTMQLVLC